MGDSGAPTIVEPTDAPPKQGHAGPDEDESWTLPDCWNVGGCPRYCRDGNLTKCDRRTCYIKFMWLVNFAVICFGVAMVVFFSVNAGQRVLDERSNPTTTISINKFETLAFPQVLICNEYVNLTNFGCKLHQQIKGRRSEPTLNCYDQATGAKTMALPQAGCPGGGGASSDDDHDPSASWKCDDSVEWIQSIYDESEVFCYKFNGYKEETTFGDLRLPLESLGAGYMNRVDLSWRLDMIGVENTTAKIQQYLDGMFLGVYTNDHELTSDDMETANIFIAPSVWNMFRCMKTTHRRLDVTSHFFNCFPGVLPSQGIGEYNLAFAFDDLSVQTITESIAYGIPQAIAEVGGISGLLLGTKLLTFVDWLSKLGPAVP